MVDKALSSIADVIIVDTTGFILGEAGKELKRRKIDLLSPRFIITLQKANEIEHVLDSYKENPLCKILRLPLSNQVRPKDMEERKINRVNKFQDYFKHAVSQELAIENVQIEGAVLDPNGEVLPPDWALRISGLLIGLKDDNDETLALGVTRNYFEEKKVLRVITPLGEMERVKTIQLSSQKVIPLYEEEKF
jgi:polynucleotide 5'-hydroxyl-kinase GRC3/NOL9